MITSTEEFSTPMSAIPTTILIRYVEIWVPDSTQGNIDCELAARITNDTLEELEVTLPAAKVGDGIAGSAWKQEGPVILQDMPCAELQAANERTGMELESLVAIPILDGRKLINVVVLGIGSGYGGLEIWSRDDRDELSLSGSFYRGLDSFEYMSQYVRFPRGSGLPGACWKGCRPKMVNNPDTNPNFIRSFAKDPADLATCLGIPVSRDFGSSAYVLLALSSVQCPLAKQIDVVDCESKKLTEDNPHPTIAPVEVSSTEASLMNDGWVATVCDRLAANRKTMLTRSGVRRDGQESVSLVIPFFERNRLTSYVSLRLT